MRTFGGPVRTSRCEVVRTSEPGASTGGQPGRSYAWRVLLRLQSKQRRSTNAGPFRCQKDAAAQRPRERGSLVSLYRGKNKGDNKPFI